MVCLCCPDIDEVRSFEQLLKLVPLVDTHCKILKFCLNKTAVFKQLIFVAVTFYLLL